MKAPSSPRTYPIRDSNGDAVSSRLEREDSPPKIMCSHKCKGDLVNDHECQRVQTRGFRITCLSDRCKKTFTNKNDFKRHCKFWQETSQPYRTGDHMQPACGIRGKLNFRLDPASSASNIWIKALSTLHITCDLLWTYMPCQALWVGGADSSKDKKQSNSSSKKYRFSIGIYKGIE